MLQLFRKRVPPTDLLTSRLYNEQDFYPALLRDLHRCANELLIESPFIASSRMRMLLPEFRRLQRRGVRVTVNTRDPVTHCPPFDAQARDAIAMLQQMGVRVLYTGGHHRKLVVVDRRVLYEGSLNVLSQNNSCEVMRRIESEELAREMVGFVRLGRFCK